MEGTIIIAFVIILIVITLKFFNTVVTDNQVKEIKPQIQRPKNIDDENPYDEQTETDKYQAYNSILLKMQQEKEKKERLRKLRSAEYIKTHRDILIKKFDSDTDLSGTPEYLYYLYYRVLFDNQNLFGKLDDKYNIVRFNIGPYPNRACVNSSKSPRELGQMLVEMLDEKVEVAMVENLYLYSEYNNPYDRTGSIFNGVISALNKENEKYIEDQRLKHIEYEKQKKREHDKAILQEQQRIKSSIAGKLIKKTIKKLDRFSSNEAGIYLIVNNKTLDFYIGESQNMSVRRKTHLGDFVDENHHSKLMQEHFNRYGKNTFDFYVLETNRMENENTRKYAEERWIKDYKPTYNT